MDECRDNLGGAYVLSTLDANCGYSQIPIDVRHDHNTFFRTHMGLFQ